MLPLKFTCPWRSTCDLVTADLATDFLGQGGEGCLQAQCPLLLCVPKSRELPTPWKINRETQFTYFGLPHPEHQRRERTLFFILQLACKSSLCRKLRHRSSQHQSYRADKLLFRAGKNPLKDLTMYFREIQVTFTCRETEPEMPGHSLFSQSSS